MSIPKNNETDERARTTEQNDREQARANFACPICNRELTPGPSDSWVCRHDDMIVREIGGDEDEF
jgi:hypothetical protein